MNRHYGFTVEFPSFINSIKTHGMLELSVFNYQLQFFGLEIPLTTLGS